MGSESEGRTNGGNPNRAVLNGPIRAARVHVNMDTQGQLRGITNSSTCSRRVLGGLLVRTDARGWRANLTILGC